MELKDVSKWFWDIAKYVITAVIISSFLGGFRDNTALLYISSFSVATVLIVIGIYIYQLSKKK